MSLQGETSKFIHVFMHITESFENVLCSRDFAGYGEMKLNVIYSLPLWNFKLWKLSYPSWNS